MAAIGSEAIFNIVITNRTQSNINKLIVKDRFDPGLEFLDSNKKILKSPIEYDLGDLPAGKPSRFNLAFHVLQAGNLCHTVEVIRQGDVMARAQACVMVSGQAGQPPGIASPGGQLPSRSAAGAAQGAAPGNRLQTPPGSRQGAAESTTPSTGTAAQSVTIKQTGPKSSQHAVGDMVSFVSRIANPNNRALSNVKITYHFDPALVPKFATDHFRAENGNLAWSLPVLPAGGYTQIEVQYKCEKAASKAGNTVSVTSSEGAQVQDTAYLDIRPASGGAEAGASTPGGALSGAATPGGTVPGGTPWSARQKSGENQGGDNQSAAASKTNQPSGPLTLTVAALHNPVAVGKELTYVIRVVNNTGLSDHEVTLTALVPDGMIPVPLGTKGPGSMQPDIDRQTVAFNPVVVLQPGETLTYQVRVLAKSAGQPVFRAKLTSQNKAQPIIEEAKIEVFEP